MSITRCGTTTENERKGLIMRMSARTLPLMLVAFGLTLALGFAITPSLAAAAGARVHAQSQEPTNANERAERARERLEEVQKRLELTPEQVEHVRPIFLDEFQQLKSIRDKYGDDQNRRGKLKMAREMRDVQKSTDDKLKKILTSKQMDELKKIREERRQQLRERA
jgi:hypothetical protein